MSKVLKKIGSCVMSLFRSILPTIAGLILSMACFSIICINIIIVFAIKSALT